MRTIARKVHGRTKIILQKDEVFLQEEEQQAMKMRRSAKLNALRKAFAATRRRMRATARKLNRERVE